MSTNQLPNRLKTVDGVLQMQDGSDVQTYLNNHHLLANCDEVTLIPRDTMLKLLADAEAWRLHQALCDDRFALAA